jgi:PadR family transcriptional regulator, regulatory protein PadR
MPARDAQFLKGVVSMLLLQLLAAQEDYGYSLVVRLQSSGFEDLSEGTVYPALTRLETLGWLSSRLVKSDAGPARKYYRPTAAGTAELAAELETWKALSLNVGRVMREQTSSNPKNGEPK